MNRIPGFFSGLAVFFLCVGLVFSRLRLAARQRVFFTSFSVGVLIFLLAEIASHVVETLQNMVLSGVQDFALLKTAVVSGILFVAGTLLSLWGVMVFERRFVSSVRQSRRLAWTMAFSIGLHNFAKGLAVAQTYVMGNFSLAVLLASGFLFSNLAAGMSLGVPLSGHAASFLLVTGLAIVAAGPLLAGVFIGEVLRSQSIEILVLALASGSILYLIEELLQLGRRRESEVKVTVGLALGFLCAFVGDLLILLVIGFWGPS